MSVTSDSIQTLLKQRRDLRAFLEELRTEIADLNSKAQENVSGKSVETKKAELAPLQKVKDNPASQPSTQLAVSQSTASKSESDEKDPVAEKVDNKTNKENDDKESGSDSTKEQGREKSDSPPLKAGDHPAIDVSATDKNPADDYSGSDNETLVQRAKLLSDYFLNHPAPVDQQSLTQLDGAVKKSEQATTPEQLDSDIEQLRNAYRIVSSKSYSATGVNGATLADSRGHISLLWAVPLYISGLILVFFPLILLVRSLAARMFVADFSVETTFVMTGITAFLWGSVGALSYLTWDIAKQARKNTYLQGSIRDVGFRASLGGLLGVVVFLVLAGVISIENIAADMAIGMLSFFVGLASSIIYSLLHHLISHMTGKVEKKP